MSQSNLQKQESLITEENDVVLSVEGVSKKFCRDLKRSLFYGVQDIGQELLGLRGEKNQLRKGEFWALQDVSFQLKKGEALGLVGKNGSGKTTLLKIIAGLIRPDIGSVNIKGRIAPLIALGAGFNPILTGRENIYANMSILGLSNKEIDDRFDEVVEFSEIGEAIDAPVQSYSSGMAARLGFASAIHTEPEILLIDEVLAVGDVKFRGKCIRRLAKLRERGTAFIFVSHNSMAIMSVSNFAIYLNRGNLIASGSTEQIIKKYEEDLFSIASHISQGMLSIPAKSAVESSGIDIVSLKFINLQEEIMDFIVSGESACFCAGLKVHQNFEDVSLRIQILEMAGENNTVLFLSGWLDEQFFDLKPGDCEIRINLPYVGLKPGLYMASINIRKGKNFIFDTVEGFRFLVKGDASMSQCNFYQPRSWILKN